MKCCLLLVACVCVVWFAGCSSPSPSSAYFRTTPLTVTLIWGGRDAASGDPASARSCQITAYPQDQTDGTVGITWIVNRGSTHDQYAAAYTSRDRISPGAWTVRTDFYSAAGAGGSLLATATQQVTVTEEGSGVEPVTVADPVTQVVVDDRTLYVGDTGTLTYRARSADGAWVALPRDVTVQWQVTVGSDVLKCAGNNAQALTPGTAQVTVTVATVGSNTATFTVLRRPTLYSEIVLQGAYKPEYFYFFALGLNQTGDSGPIPCTSGANGWGIMRGQTAEPPIYVIFHNGIFALSMLGQYSGRPYRSGVSEDKRHLWVELDLRVFATLLGGSPTPLAQANWITTDSLTPSSTRPFDGFGVTGEEYLAPIPLQRAGSWVSGENGVPAEPMYGVMERTTQSDDALDITAWQVVVTPANAE